MFSHKTVCGDVFERYSSSKLAGFYTAVTYSPHTEMSCIKLCLTSTDTVCVGTMLAKDQCYLVSMGDPYNTALDVDYATYARVKCDMAGRNQI
jgi:hypothetical protein